jgi:hypothetical protein
MIGRLILIVILAALILWAALAHNWPWLALTTL